MEAVYCEDGSLSEYNLQYFWHSRVCQSQVTNLIVLDTANSCYGLKNIQNKTRMKHYYWWWPPVACAATRTGCACPRWRGRRCRRGGCGSSPGRWCSPCRGCPTHPPDRPWCNCRTFQLVSESEDDWSWTCCSWADLPACPVSLYLCHCSPWQCQETWQSSLQELRLFSIPQLLSLVSKLYLGLTVREMMATLLLLSQTIDLVLGLVWCFCQTGGWMNLHLKLPGNCTDYRGQRWPRGRMEVGQMENQSICLGHTGGGYWLGVLGFYHIKISNLKSWVCYGWRAKHLPIIYSNVLGPE